MLVHNKKENKFLHSSPALRNWISSSEAVSKRRDNRLIKHSTQSGATQERLCHLTPCDAVYVFTLQGQICLFYWRNDATCGFVTYAKGTFLTRVF
jgi:hypothetical protein